ncbi:uncharacterized protein N7482_001751 [Penicillium canariense]|uniref:NF-kappa-B inhibitor-like protein 1 n=1 Tax=Penicillium canariense TaxID=189055 RepID=A0A9W9IGK4_9EURO|nr:uncharacterized protein N7482_001751 [Penicillium canariense]KAJ5175874.1 hypothetical protein N7482_001751 [Penicillium canariense]
MASQPPEGTTSTAHPSDDYTHPNRSKGRFRFKSRPSRDKRHHDPNDSARSHDSERDHKRRHGSPRSSRRNENARPSKRRDRHHRSTEPPDPTKPPPLSPSAAFRESLFDALGDDEGAAYWESVYGQPIHNYAVPEVPKGPDGELEQMSDEEYATYVRSRMWERTREGMLEEQERLRAERKKARRREDERGAKERERGAFEQAMDESLRRGAERKKRKNWDVAWKAYLASWKEIAKVVPQPGSTTQSAEADEADAQRKPLRDLLFWPVESGKRRDVNPDSVQEFLRHAPMADLLATLKAERVRWHPDKIQHRYSALGIEDAVMRSVTEVFQIVDRMWGEERERIGEKT